LNAPTNWAALIFNTDQLAYPHLPTPLINYLDGLTEVVSQVGSTIDSNCDPIQGSTLMTPPPPTDTIYTASGTPVVSRLPDTSIEVPTQAGQKQGGDPDNTGTGQNPLGGGDSGPTGQGPTGQGPTGQGPTGQGNDPTSGGSNAGNGNPLRTSNRGPSLTGAGGTTNLGTVLTPGSSYPSGAVASPTPTGGEFLGSMTWPAGCESWTKPCPPGAPVSGGGRAGGNSQTGSSADTSDFVMWYPLTDASGSSTSFLVTVPRITVGRVTITVTSMANNRTNITTTRNMTMTQTTTFVPQGQGFSQTTAWAERIRDLRLGLIGSILATAFASLLFWL
jgi:hypothetical protein